MNPRSESQVLMIDDDENDAMLIRHMVGKMPEPGCQFRWAGSYDQGLKELSEFNFDLCLVDYQLGAHTGVQVVTEAHTRGVTCPFLLLTGAGSRAIDLLAMGAGVKGYLEKSRLCPLDLERAMRYAIGSGQAPEASGGAASARVPPDVVELLRAAFNSKQAFVVIALLLDHDAVLRNRLTTRQTAHLNTELENLVRARISTGEALVRTPEGAQLLVSFSQGARDARQFLALLLAEPLSVSTDDRSKSVSLPAILRRNVFSSEGYAGPVPLLEELHAFLDSSPRRPGSNAKNF
jgi:DNA-binding NarL/FixJ family response regulator